MPRHPAFVGAELLSIPESFDTGDFREMVQNHVASERVRWWKAVMDPTYSPKSGVMQTRDGRDKWIREEQVDLRESCRALIVGVEAARKYMDVAQFAVGTVQIITMPDELPIGEGDWVVPIGRDTVARGQSPDARTLVHKYVLERGASHVAVSGLVSSSGTTVTGLGSTFLSDFKVGDLILAANQAPRVISAIASNGSLTVDDAPSPAWNGHSYSKACEKMLGTPVALIDEIRDADRSYRAGTHFNVAADEETVRWLTDVQPAPGARYSIVYRYWPKYVVMGDAMGMAASVCRTGLPQRVIGKLVLPEMRN